jgi:hypothetical protein
MLQGGTVRVLGRIALRKVSPQRRKILGESFHFQRSLAGLAHGRASKAAA